MFQSKNYITSRDSICNFETFFKIVSATEKDTIRKSAEFINEKFKCGKLIEITSDEGGHYIEIIKDGGYEKE